jgi:RNA polymerase sigma factor (sigma-70 family)
MQDAVVTQSLPSREPLPRPSRAQIEPAALALLARHSAGLLATARRYSVSPEDAEDAYQRGVEILLTKAPTTREAELLPWLRTVVKHEAFAVRKSNSRSTPIPIGPAGGEPGKDAPTWNEDRHERYEQLRIGAEAMAALKPQELRCLLLRAEGLSYKEICEATGWTYTKVNRSITEGRRAFLKRVASIETGAECERLAPLISKAADGEASPDEMRRARPHLKGCLACKATLREYRLAPARLAGLVPPVVALAGAPAGGGATGFAVRTAQALHDRFAALTETATAQKAAAVAASAALLAGGGAAGVEAIHHDAPRVAPAAFERAAVQTARPQAAGPAPTSADPAPVAPARSAFAPAAAAPAPAAARPAPAPAPEAAPEFDPGTAYPHPAPAPPRTARQAPRQTAEFGP